MTAKLVSFKLKEEKIEDIKKVAEVFRVSMTDIVNEALDNYLNELKNDPFYMLSHNIEEASKEESQEIVEAINKLSNDDLKIVSKKKVVIG